MGRGPAKDKAIALAPATAVPSNSELDDLIRKRDAFVTSMTLLRNAAEGASRAGLAYFDHIIGTAPNGDHPFAFQRGVSAPVRAITEEPEAGMKRTRRKREKRDPDLPKRPMTAYLLFCNDGRETVKKDLGENATHKEVIAELTRRWAEVPEEQKKAWQDLYQTNRAVYDKAIAEYKASKDPQFAATPSATAATIAAAAAAPAGGFTAVNHTETAGDSEPESEPEHEEEPAPAPAKVPEPEPELESELSEAEEEVPEEAEEEEEEEEKSPSPPPKSPTPPPRPKATPRGKKGAANGTKKTPLPASPPKEKEKRKRTSTRKKAAAEEEAVVAEEGPKKRGKKRRKSTGD